uniref:Uncharacterized protein n=1 Tax=Timema genevievae TaxID=629358 RepID=A0A7R9PMG4_TIMGE|nr:unnamed protein product [Timema genevievae]
MATRQLVITGDIGYKTELGITGDTGYKTELVITGDTGYKTELGLTGDTGYKTTRYNRRYWLQDRASTALLFFLRGRLRTVSTSSEARALTSSRHSGFELRFALVRVITVSTLQRQLGWFGWVWLRKLRGQLEREDVDVSHV